MMSSVIEYLVEKKDIKGQKKTRKAICYSSFLNAFLTR